MMHHEPDAKMFDPATQKKTVDSGAPASDIEDTSVSSAKDILENEGEDPVLAMKMHLVNDANDEIDWTNFHWKLFVLNGFGYAVDSLIALVQSVTNAGAMLELGKPSTYSNAGTVSLYVGLLIGAIFWGFGADIIGRRIAFNVTLLITSLATIVSGASPNIESWGFFTALSAFGAGGNLVLDPTVFLEFLPSNKQWTVTALALWWGFGQALVGFIAWGFLTQERWNCTEGMDCNWSNNPGWRYVSFTSGAFVFVASVARVTVMRLQETPKYLLSVGRDEDLVRNYQKMAQKYNRPCSLTLEKLTACGQIKNAGQSRNNFKFVLRELGAHVKGLFYTKRMTLSTVLVWLSWTLIGLAYPLFYVFLPSYLASRVPDSTETPFETWRNYTLTNISGIPGPIIAGYLANLPRIGRKYTMAIGALLSMAFFFGYTAVSTADQNIGLSCAIACAINIYYGTLYAYTVEVFPSAHRATGNGIAVAFNRLMGIVSAFVASSGNTATSVPLYVCAALFGVMAGVSALFPFEPYGKRSS